MNKVMLDTLNNVVSDGYIGMLGIGSFFIAVALFIVITPLILLMYKQKKNRWDGFWNFWEHHLTPAFVVVWLLGFIIYLTGSSIVPIGSSPLECIGCLICQAPMACVHALEMFVLDSDVGAIQNEFHSNLLFMSCFSLVHFLAAFVSTMFVIKYFGYNLIAKMKLSYAIHLKGGLNELYIFWGMNEATYCLAKNIENVLGSRNVNNYEIIIMNIVEDKDENREKHAAMERLFSFISFKNEELQRYKEIGCLTANVFNNFAKVKIDNYNKNDEKKCDVLVEQMDVRSLAKLIKKTKNKVHIFFLGNNEEDNILGTAMLCHDTTINSNGTKTYIYCHARYDSVNRVIEDEYSNEKIEVRVLDSSRDSINLLRCNKDFHPINFVDIDTVDNIGTVTSEFCSMVIGFGETGRDAVRFLYEYGAFVDCHSSKENGKVERSPFHCYVVDKEAERLSGQFFATSPAVKNIVVWNTDITAFDFYKKLESICKKLNYVIIALGDDEMNITTAVRLFKYVHSHREENKMNNFKIFVRCHNHEKKSHLQRIADHYNQKGKTEYEQDYITIFGTEDQLYTYEQVIENDFEDEGKHYNEFYCVASNDDGSNKWETRHRNSLTKKTIENLAKLRRKESQDIANAYHAATKLFIMEKVATGNDGKAKSGMEHIYECLRCKNLLPFSIGKDTGKGFGSIILDKNDKYCKNKIKAPYLLEKEDEINYIPWEYLIDYIESVPFISIFSKKGNNNNEIKNRIFAQNGFSEKEQLLFLNLARLEHLRWNAAHEVMGYQSYKDGDSNCELVKDEGDNRHGCNETFKLHNCLLDWQDLDTEMNDEKNMYHSDYKYFDYVVITATLMHNYKRMKSRK